MDNNIITNIIKKILNKNNLFYLTNNNILTGGREPSFDEKNFNQGIHRKKVNDKFEYFYIKTNKPVTKNDLDRINNLKIPPSWTNVWISIEPETPIQAIGIDAKDRKQYKYNETHIEQAEKEKFLRLIDFIKYLPELMKVIKNHQMKHIYDKDKVISTMLLLVKMLHIRVGKEQYARENKSYGIASLKKKHVKINGELVNLRFKGKSRQILNYSFRNNEIKNHITLLLKLGGDKLFQYIDDNDNIRKVTDLDLNTYIQQYMGTDFSIKDFRTYAANYHFVESLIQETNKRSPKNEKVIKKNIVNALKKTAHYLRHTQAISKKSYVMNFAIDVYKNNPKYFTSSIGDIDNILLDLLKLYKQKIIK